MHEDGDWKYKHGNKILLLHDIQSGLPISYVYVAHLDNKINVHLCILTVSMASPNWIAVSK